MDPWQQFSEQRELLRYVKIDGKWPAKSKSILHVKIVNPMQNLQVEQTQVEY